MFCFFFKQKTAYEMRISDWSSDVCSSDLTPLHCGCAVSGQGRQCVEDQLSVREIDGFGQTSCTRRVERGCGRVFIEVGVIEVRILRSEERRVGKEGVDRVDLGGRRIIKKKKYNNQCHITKPNIS